MASASTNILSFASFNCRGFRNSKEDIFELTRNFDIVALQEHWLPRQNLYQLAEVNPDYSFTAVSPVDLEDGPILGRPYGGVAILWKNELASCVSIVQSYDSRIVAISITDGHGCKYLVVNVYLPFQCAENSDLYLEYLGKLRAMFDNTDCSRLVILGDFNANLGTAFYRFLTDFCSEEDLTICDVNYFHSLNEHDVFTYISDAHATTSWLDHVVCSKNIALDFSNFNVLVDFQISDHFPLAFELKLCICDRIEDASEPVNRTPRVDFDSLSEPQAERFKRCLMESVNNIAYPEFDCSGACHSVFHRECIDNFARDFVSVIRNAELSICSQWMGVGITRRNVPGWNTRVKQKYADSRESFLRWVHAGRPSEGPVYQARKRSRTIFKQALHRCRVEKDLEAADRLASHYLAKNYSGFWKAVQANDKSRLKPATRVGDVVGAEGICKEWKNHFEKLFNSVNNSKLPDMYDEFEEYAEITVDEVSSAIKGISSGKSPGLDGIRIETLKFGIDVLAPCVTVFLNMCLSHSHFPKLMSEVYLMPIIKNKCLDNSSLSNYRPIAVSSAISKLLEFVLRERLGPFIRSSDNQFSYKSGHGTDSCVFLLKESVRHYCKLKSYVHCAFLDSSKAFDKINHCKLFSKLEERNVPDYLVSFLKRWYIDQIMCVKWGGCQSETFFMSNGVRQGSLLSPLLFSLYMDQLSLSLNNTRVGLFVGYSTLNHIMYADDLSLFSPSLFGLRRLMEVCELYAEMFDISFNSEKSACIRFSNNNLNFKPGSIYLNGTVVRWCESITYLGVKLSNNLSDRSEIENQLRKFYCRSNGVLRKFHSCSIGVKLLLFQSFCSNFYQCPLWLSYPKFIYDKVKVAYNNMLRRIVGLPRYYSASEMFVYYRMDNLDAIVRKSRANLYFRLGSMENVYIRSFLESSAWESSLFRKFVRDQSSLIV